MVVPKDTLLLNALLDLWVVLAELILQSRIHRTRPHLRLHQRGAAHIWINSRMTLLSNTGTGLRSLAKAVRANTQGFERDGASSGKRVHHKRPSAERAAQRLMRCLRERAVVSRYSRTVGSCPN